MPKASWKVDLVGRSLVAFQVEKIEQNIPIDEARFAKPVEPSAKPPQ